MKSPEFPFSRVWPKLGRCAAFARLFSAGSFGARSGGGPNMVAPAHAGQHYKAGASGPEFIFGPKRAGGAGVRVACAYALSTTVFSAGKPANAVGTLPLICATDFVYVSSRLWSKAEFAQNAARGWLDRCCGDHQTVV